MDDKWTALVIAAGFSASTLLFAIAISPRSKALTATEEPKFHIDRFGNDVVMEDDENSSSDDDDDTVADEGSDGDELEGEENLDRNEKEERRETREEIIEAEQALSSLWLPLPLEDADEKWEKVKAPYMPSVSWSQHLYLKCDSFSYNENGEPLYLVQATFSAHKEAMSAKLSYATIREFRDGLFKKRMNFTSASVVLDNREGGSDDDSDTDVDENLSSEVVERHEIREALQLCEELSPFPAPIAYTFYLTEELVVNQRRRLDNYLRRISSNQRFMRSSSTHLDMEGRICAAFFV